jgi:hypothetical protein
MISSHRVSQKKKVSFLLRRAKSDIPKYKQLPKKERMRFMFAHVNKAEIILFKMIKREVAPPLKKYYGDDDDEERAELTMCQRWERKMSME